MGIEVNAVVGDFLQEATQSITSLWRFMMATVDEASRKVAQALVDLNVSGQVIEFDQPLPTAAVAATRLECEVGAIANSLIFAINDEPLLVVASGARRVDLAKVEQLLAVKGIRRASKEFVLEHTGQPVGGVGPVGHPKPIRAVVDVALKRFDKVWAGAGNKHAMFPTTFDELVRMTNGIAAEVGE